MFDTGFPACTASFIVYNLHKLHIHFVLVVLLTTKMTANVLKKYIGARTKGTLTEQLGDGKYLVEYETDKGNFRF